MKIKCPKCNKPMEIGDQSRFEIFRCGSCQYAFVGLEAELSPLNQVLGFFFGTGREFNYLNIGKTPCQHCGAAIQLWHHKDRPGYEGPSACHSCGRKLRRRKKIMTEQDVLPSTASPANQPSAPTSPPRLTEDEIEAARIVADVQAGRLPAPLAPGEDQMTPEEEAEYQELKRGFEELDRKKSEKLAGAPVAPAKKPKPVDEWWQGMKCPYCGSPMFPRAAEPNFPRCPNAPGNQMYCS